MKVELCFPAWVYVGVLALAALSWAAPETASEVKSAGAETSVKTCVEISYDFEDGSLPPPVAGTYNTPVSVQRGKGAFGSSGFLRVGPNNFKWTGVMIKFPFTVSRETWLGFSARKDGGGAIDLQGCNLKLQKNFSVRFDLPMDGSWRTFHVALAKRYGLSEEAPFSHISFYVENPLQGPVTFNLDNICIGQGKPNEPPAAPAGIAVQYNNNIGHVTWQAPRAPCGLMEYRIYRGLDPAFARDECHLIDRRQDAAFDDSAFASPRLYYYAVRAVDFAGHEGPDAGIVTLNIPKGK